jgi:hypothetical protein
MKEEVHCENNSLATGVISRGAIMLGDGFRIHARVFGVHASSSGVFNPGGGVASSGGFVPAGSCNRVSDDAHWTRWVK